MARKREEGKPTRRSVADDLWRRVSEPGAGARARGYLRFSNQAGHYGLTLEGQRQHIRAYCEERGWTLLGFDEEPAQSAKYEEIEQRPVFQRHLADAVRGAFDVSLCYMADRWARNKITAFVSISQLRKVGVWWATTDGKWTIDRTEEDGWDVAFAVEVTLNAAYSRKVSDKTRIGKQTRASLGFPNGDVMFGYQRAADPPRPVGAPLSWKPPRQPLEPHPINFTRLQQMGAWAAAGLSDTAIAERANAEGWRTQTQKAIGPRLHYREPVDETSETGETSESSKQSAVHLTQDVVGPRPFSKDSIRSILLNAFPREFAPGSGVGTIWTPAGERIAGRHPAAWSWDVWQRMDEQRALRTYGSRGQTRGQQAEHAATHPADVWVFSGYLICAACGSRLRADASHGGQYRFYRDTARVRGIACPLLTPASHQASRDRHRSAPRSVREAVVEAQFASLLNAPFPADWRERISAQVASDAQVEPDWQATDLRREQLARELERLKFQHRHGLVDDDDLVREAARLQQALAALPSPETQDALVRESLALGEALAASKQRLGSLAAYWQVATAERRVALVTGLLRPEGLRYDLAARQIVGLALRVVALPVLRTLLPEWRLGSDGWLTPPGTIPGVMSGVSGVSGVLAESFPLSDDARYVPDDDRGHVG